MEALEWFWHHLAEWLNMMIGWENEAIESTIENVLELESLGKGIHITNPTGFAQIVRRMIREVEQLRLPSGQNSLFLTAANHFEILCEQHGFAEEDSLWYGVVKSDDPHFRALRKLVTERIPVGSTIQSVMSSTEPINASPELVTLDQAAAAAHRSKRSLERYKTKGTLPLPHVEGGGGRPDLWDWKTMGPWLEATFGIPQPKCFPGSRRP